MYGIGARLTLGVGVDRATAYVVGLYDQAIWRLRLGKWERLPAFAALGGIGAGWDGTLWAAESLGSSNSVSQYAAGAWQAIWQGQAPVSAIGGSATSVWVADILGNVFNVADGQTTSLPLPGGVTVTAFCATRGGQILAAANGNVYQFANGQWSVYSAFPSENYVAIQVTGNSALWAVTQNPDGNLALQYQDANGNWDAVAGPPTGLAAASPNQDGSVFALDGNGTAWLLPQVGGTWQRQITPTGMNGLAFGGGVTEEVVKGEQFAQNFFTNLQTEVDNDLDAIGAYFGVQSLNNAASSPSTTSQVSWPSLPNSMPSSVFLSGTQINWLIDKVEAAIFGTSSPIPPVPNLFNFGQACYNAAEAGWANLKAAVDDFKDYIMNLVQQPSDFEQLAVEDLFNAVKATVDAALEFADAIVQALLDLVGNALSYIDTLLNYAMDIPLVSFLFQEFTGQQLTAQNLFTMLAAAPVTIVYKLMGGGRYLFTDAQVQEIIGGGRKAAAEPGEDPALVSAFGYCAAGLNLVWAIFDTCLDAVQVTPPVGLQLMDIIFSSLVQIFGWPGGVPMTAPPMDTKAEKWGFGNWVTGWSPIGLNIALMLVGTFGTLTAQDARYIDGLGQGVLTAIGLVNLGVGAAASALGQKDGSVSAYGVVANTLSPMSNLFQFLRIEALEEASEMLTYYIKLLLDFFCGAGTSLVL
jgi:hypothetical protein